LIFGEFGTGALLLVIATIAFSWIARSFRNETPPPSVALVEQREAVAAD
jgi:hypothetical protein